MFGIFMTAICTRTLSLRVYQILRNDDASIDNAEVLCQGCYKATLTHGQPLIHSLIFSFETNEKVMEYSGHQCQCTHKYTRVDSEGRHFHT